MVSISTYLFVDLTGMDGGWVGGGLVCYLVYLSNEFTYFYLLASVIVAIIREELIV